MQKQVPLLILGVVVQNGGTPTYSPRHAIAGLIQTFLTYTKILNGLAIHLI